MRCIGEIQVSGEDRLDKKYRCGNPLAANILPKDVSEIRFVYNYRFFRYRRLVILSTVIEVRNAKEDSNKMFTEQLPRL